MMCNRLRKGEIRRKDIKKCKAGNEERGICSRRHPFINAMNRITTLFKICLMLQSLSD